MNKEDLMQYLISLDNQFCQESQISGEQAWKKYLAEDAVMVTGGHRDYIIGKDIIVDSLKGLYRLNDIHFIWEPKRVDVSDDLKMGYTTGIYTRTYQFNGTNHKEIGKYTTIWKLIDNFWKIVLDIGNEETVSEKSD